MLRFLDSFIEAYNLFDSHLEGKFLQYAKDEIKKLKLVIAQPIKN